MPHLPTRALFQASPLPSIQRSASPTEAQHGESVLTSLAPTIKSHPSGGLAPQSAPSGGLAPQSAPSPAPTSLAAHLVTSLSLSLSLSPSSPLSLSPSLSLSLSLPPSTPPPAEKATGTKQDTLARQAVARPSQAGGSPGCAAGIVCPSTQTCP